MAFDTALEYERTAVAAWAEIVKAAGDVYSSDPVFGDFINILKPSQSGRRKIRIQPAGGLGSWGRRHRTIRVALKYFLKTRRSR